MLGVRVIVIRMYFGGGSSENMERYCCCFCNETIEGCITTLLAVTNWQETDENKQQSQQLFCHLDCLGKALHGSSFLYIDEEDVDEG